MRYVAAYILASMGGNNNPSADDIKLILGSVGVEADDGSIKKVLKEMKGKKIDDLIATGATKLASMPSGGGASAAAPAEAGGAAPAADKKKEEKKEESENESDDDMGFGLFD